MSHIGQCRTGAPKPAALSVNPNPALLLFTHADQHGNMHTRALSLAIINTGY